jgi:hypothetical protein
VNTNFWQRRRCAHTPVIMGAITLLLMVVASWMLWKPPPASPKAAPVAAKSRIQQAVDYIRSEKFDDAFLAADAEEVRLAFLREIKLAETNQSPRLRIFYAGYLDHAPLPRECRHRALKDWNNIVSGLHTLEIIPDVAIAEPDGNSEARVLFDQILAISVRRMNGSQQRDSDMPEVRSLARKILRKYPDSIYCPMAVVAAARLDGWHPESVESYLDDLGRGNIRSRLALLRLAADERRWNSSPDERQRTIAMYREILTSSTIDSEKAHAQYEIARLTIEVKSPSKIAEGKQLLSDYWQKYPKSADASWARFYFVQASIEQGDLDQSRALIEEFRQEDPNWSMAATAYVQLAAQHRPKGEFARELEILRRATDNYSGTSAASLAWATIANQWLNLPVDRDQIVALEMAMIPVTAAVDQPAMDRGEIRQAAKQRLEKIYFHQEQWRKCLELCLRPRFDSLAGCGNYITMKYEEECGYVNSCIQHLPAGDSLCEQGIAFLKSHGRRRYLSVTQAMSNQVADPTKDNP